MDVLSFTERNQATGLAPNSCRLDLLDQTTKPLISHILGCLATETRSSHCDILSQEVCTYH